MGLTQVNTSYYLGQSYHIGRNILTPFAPTLKSLLISTDRDKALKQGAIERIFLLKQLSLN